MKFKFSFHQIPHSDFIVNAVQSKIGRSMELLFGMECAKVSVEKKGYEFSIGISINGRRGVFYKATAKAENLYAAIDKIQDKLEKQFKRERKKLQNHKRPALSKEGRLELIDEELNTNFSPYKRKSIRKKAA